MKCQWIFRIDRRIVSLRQQKCKTYSSDMFQDRRAAPLAPRRCQRWQVCRRISTDSSLTRSPSSHFDVSADNESSALHLNSLLIRKLGSLDYMLFIHHKCRRNTMTKDRTDRVHTTWTTHYIATKTLNKRQIACIHCQSAHRSLHTITQLLKFP